MKLRVAVAGGVTGGHLYPAISILEHLEKFVDVEVLYFSVKGKLEERIIPKIHPEYSLESLDVQGLKRPLTTYENVARLFKILKSKQKVLKVLRGYKPDFVIVTGGYVSYPVGIAAHKLKIPLFVQEQNVVPGLSNLKLSKYASKIFLSFKDSRDYFPKKLRDKLMVTGNPIRISSMGKKLSYDKPVILIIGGSGGSEFLNEVACKLAKELKNSYIILSSGGKKVPCKNGNLKVLNYIDNMVDYYNVASCVIARGGATTISELLYFDLPSVIIPWEGSTESHQLENARQIEKEGLGIVVKESEFSFEKILEKVRECVNLNKRNVKRKINPAEVIAREIIREVKRV
ncbi:UDP-N-acetylglucosamine--N-acetylmuramyl-(pentapeptide) pyrophosphoryl-undecaprenol N-acetylglucosamine transferase [Thermosipho ferrireducens]|uniref:UDP-N-acetylglucosamine--N-acetylmuramyl-(pentapeptide) pyrophosphoryl-undecaprenol N-acetylglucosamine transferase n=1 Tax=Thermosipho ferrireducens TaxID=2571116 RepID=A0ABX7S9M5_9BACT|nr:UDP-N-acetylglucosamine--N-acetylmuramyl-(pentapeptide) pyrophosphoryl-undecaprenol N-acetylglucosamine transferase [Thermosipho ferrireducens]QTA38601.1 UDP-N-acetylglucosamine--N-acetylmuramyl-(pentapeptide) pyrophosphoryl-undecaprenol N-acetylglucosamine transferase [Thermosipho ferrireducens]